MTVGHTHKNVELRMRQFAVAAEARESLALAKAFVIGKVKNCRTMLRRHLPGDERPELRSLADLVLKAERASSAESLLGIDGMAAKVYFAGFAKLLDGGEAFDIEGRNRRPLKDPVNALLSFVYSLLTKELTIVLRHSSLSGMRNACLVGTPPGLISRGPIEALSVNILSR